MQLFWIGDAWTRGDKRFGFQMFSQSSSFRAHLYRELADGRRVPAPGGEWSTGGTTYRWRRFVRDNRLHHLERWTGARTSAEVTIQYFGLALDYVAQHVPGDRETRRFVMVVEYRKAGGVTGTVELRSRPREVRVP